MRRVRTASTWARLREWLPQGRGLPLDVWSQRHRGILVLFWLHVPALFAVATVTDGVAHAAVEAGVVAGLATLATMARPFPMLSTVIASVGLMSCSAELVHLSDGQIESHFHFFVVVGVITLYQDWRPFQVAIGFVLVHHGVVAAIDPASVYNHPAAIDRPLVWAGIHGGFIVAMSATGIMSWKLNERLLAAATHREVLLAEAQHLAAVGSWEYREGVGSTWSAEMYRLLDVDASAPSTAETVLSVLHPEDRQRWLDCLTSARARGGIHDTDVRVVRSDGSIRWLHGRGEVTEWAGDEVATMRGTVQDITDRKDAERALVDSNAAVRETLSLLQATLDSTADGILVVDDDGRITSSNRRFAEMWNIPGHVLRNGADQAAIAHVLDQLVDPEAFTSKVRDVYARGDGESFDTVRFKDGRVFERFSRPQYVDGRAVGRVWSFRDVTDRRRLERQLEHQAFHDALTGLANQVLFRDRLGHAIDRLRFPATASMAVLFLDLDNFKHINDSLGHAAGDELLIGVTSRITGQLRAADTAARLGGDEFAILLEDLQTPDEAEQVAQRLLDVLHAPFSLAGKEVFTTASIGIAGYEPGGSGEELLRHADLAMYTAKRLGKDRAERFHAQMQDVAVERLELEADLRRACERDELHLQYQPIVCLETGALNGVEALVRWRHPTRGLLPPSSFIPYAEESGLIEDIGVWVLERACRQARRWHEQSPDRKPIGISVNLSVRQLRNPEMAATVEQVLRRTGLDAGQLTLEITESAMMFDTNVALLRLRELKALGVRLALDDFGTGYSSLSYLQTFPIDVIKIDRTFVDQVERGTDEAVLAHAIVRLAQTLKLAAIAEGVENEAQRRWLRGIGCTLAQGFHLSRPVDAEEIDRMLSAGSSLLR